MSSVSFVVEILKNTGKARGLYDCETVKTKLAPMSKKPEKAKSKINALDHMSVRMRYRFLKAFFGKFAPIDFFRDTKTTRMREIILLYGEMKYIESLPHKMR